MGERRMFSTRVVETDNFTDMPLSAQALYFHLGMNTDDEGFVSNPKRIMRMVSCNQDDMTILITKGFVIAFDSGVIVITHHHINNSLRKDRQKPTFYQEERAMVTDGENDKAYRLTTNCQPCDNQVTTNCQPNDRLTKPNQTKPNSTKISLSTEVDRQPPFDYQSVVDGFNSVCTSLPRVQKLTDKRRKAIRIAKKQLGDLTFTELFDKVERSEFLSGRNGVWSGCSFDWIMKPANLTKIIEGNYNRDTKRSGNVQETIYEGAW